MYQQYLSIKGKPSALLGQTLHGNIYIFLTRCFKKLPLKKVNGPNFESVKIERISLKKAWVCTTENKSTQ